MWSLLLFVRIDQIRLHGVVQMIPGRLFGCIRVASTHGSQDHSMLFDQVPAVLPHSQGKERVARRMKELSPDREQRFIPRSSQKSLVEFPVELR